MLWGDSLNTLMIILSAFIAFFATLSAGVFIKKLQRHVGIVCAFSSGFFIALSLFELLPDTLAFASQAQVSLGEISIVAVSGFIFLFALNKGFSRLYRSKLDNTKTYKQRIGLFSTLEFCSHAFIEGVAIGLTFQLQFELGIFVAIAVISHDFCDGISTLALMINSGNTLRSSFGMLLVDASAPIVGALTTLLFVIQSAFLVYALSFLFGSFLYIGGLVLLPDANQMNRPIVTAAFFLIGFSLILFFTIITQ
jgi:zinc transporter ZupT